MGRGDRQLPGDRSRPGPARDRGQHRGAGRRWADPRPGGPHPRGGLAPGRDGHRHRRAARGAARDRGHRGRDLPARPRAAGGRRRAQRRALRPLHGRRRARADRGRCETARSRCGRPRARRSSTSATSRPTPSYRERLGAETGLPVIDLPEVIARHFDIASLATLADALAGAAAGARDRGAAYATPGRLLRRRRRRQDHDLGIGRPAPRARGRQDGGRHHRPGAAPGVGARHDRAFPTIPRTSPPTH